MTQTNPKKSATKDRYCCKSGEALLSSRVGVWIQSDGSHALILPRAVPYSTLPHCLLLVNVQGWVKNLRMLLALQNELCMSIVVCPSHQDYYKNGTGQCIQTATDALTPQISLSHLPQRQDEYISVDMLEISIIPCSLQIHAPWQYHIRCCRVSSCQLQPIMYPAVLGQAVSIDLLQSPLGGLRLPHLICPFFSIVSLPGFHAYDAVPGLRLYSLFMFFASHVLRQLSNHSFLFDSKTIIVITFRASRFHIVTFYYDLYTKIRWSEQGELSRLLSKVTVYISSSIDLETRLFLRSHKTKCLVSLARALVQYVYQDNPRWRLSSYNHSSSLSGTPLRCIILGQGKPCSPCCSTCDRMDGNGRFVRLWRWGWTAGRQ